MVQEILNFVAALGIALVWCSPKLCHKATPRIFFLWMVVSASMLAALYFGRPAQGLAGEFRQGAELAWMAAFVHILIRYVQKRRGTLPWAPPKEAEGGGSQP